MKHHPQLYQADMVRALLREVNPKTQTRRAITAYNSLVDGHGIGQKRWDAMGFDFSRAHIECPQFWKSDQCYWQVPAINQIYNAGDESWHTIHPRITSGDRIWVKETFAETDTADGTPVVAYAAGGAIAIGRAQKSNADYLIHDWQYNDVNFQWPLKPSIHMPRWASRITLDVTAVRPERLQDISYEDALAEGVLDWKFLIENEPSDETPDATARRLRWPQQEYFILWNRINGDGAAKLNPMVWVYTFNRINNISP
jgi:hypothetical protein